MDSNLYSDFTAKSYNSDGKNLMNLNYGNKNINALRIYSTRIVMLIDGVFLFTFLLSNIDLSLLFHYRFPTLR